MARKNKPEWVKDIIKLDNENQGLLGEIQQGELEDFTIGQLKALHKEMVEELEASAPVTEDADSAKAETDDNGVFTSMCGSDFDPKKNGACHKDCQVDFPDSFKACSDNFAKSDVVKKKKSGKPAVGKTEWGHVKGKQGGLVDDFFFEGKVGTIKEIAEFAGGKEPRIMHHMKHLVADVGIEILFADKKEEIEDDGKKKKVTVRSYWWSEKDKRRKGEPLEGKSVPGWKK